MLVSFFGHRRKGPSRPAWAEADILETQHGRDGAIRHVRDQIAHADREHRRRLYQLHDELARRYEPRRRAV